MGINPANKVEDPSRSAYTIPASTDGMELYLRLCQNQWVISSCLSFDDSSHISFLIVRKSCIPRARKTRPTVIPLGEAIVIAVLCTDVHKYISFTRGEVANSLADACSGSPLLRVGGCRTALNGESCRHKSTDNRRFKSIRSGYEGLAVRGVKLSLWLLERPMCMVSSSASCERSCYYLSYVVDLYDFHC